MTRFRLATLALAVMLGGGAAVADDDLNLGGNFVPLNIIEGGVLNNNVGGGPITVSYLNGTQLAYVYCVGLFTDIFVPGDYPNTIVRNDGIVNGQSVNNAGEIAWLLNTYGVAAAGDVIKEQALQAAIWTVEYNGDGFGTAIGQPVVTGAPGQAYTSLYEQYIAEAASNTAALNTIQWFSPSNSSGNVYQGLAGPAIGPGLNSQVPEPTGILLFSTVLLCVAGLLRKKLGSGRQHN